MANLDFYGMFDFSSGDGDEYKYTSAEFANLIKGLTQNGVSTIGGDAFVTTANGLTLTVGSGTCFIQGRYGYNNNSTPINLDAETASQQRIDRIVLELNAVNRVIELKVIKGTAAGTATAPDLTQDELTYQLPLYKVLITNGSSTTLTDERNLVYSPTEINEKLQRILTGTDFVYAVYA